MEPFFTSVGKGLALMIIPDTVAHVDGHPVLTYSYSIYRNQQPNDALQERRENKLHLVRKSDPDYMGTIEFKIPGRSLNYITDGIGRLGPFEIQELVDRINAYRGDSALWPASFINYLSE
jgi:hypothetical protein